MDAGSFKRLPDGNLLMTGEISTEHPDLYLLEGEKREKALKKLAEDKDYEVLTESPFVSNGKGLIQGKRGALFLYQVKEKKLRRLTGKWTDVGDFRVYGKDVWFSGVTYRNRRPNRECLYRLNLETGKTEQALGPKLIIYTIEFIGGHAGGDRRGREAVRRQRKSALLFLRRDGKPVRMGEFKSLSAGH